MLRWEQAFARFRLAKVDFDLPIRSRIVNNDCVDEYVAAATSQISSGFTLLVANDANCVKLMGETVEMLLKATYFSFIKIAGSDSVTHSDLNAAKQEASGFGVSELAGQFHNLRFWAELIIEKRTQLITQETHPTTDELAMRDAAARISLNWDITDRYRNIQLIATPDELEEVFEDTMLLWNLYSRLRK